MGLKALVLVNRDAAQGGRAREAMEWLGRLGATLVEERIPRPGDLPKIIRRHLGRVDRVVVGGGDGTLNAAAPALVGQDTPLAILPLGTANNLARTVGIPMDVEGACRVALGGEAKSIDVGMVNDHCFFTTASIGLSVRITRELSRDSKARWGRVAYALAAARTVARARPFNAEIRLHEGRTIQTRTVQIVVGNGRYFGAALAVAHDARIDDHALDVFSLEARHWWQLVTVLPALKRGTHRQREDVVGLRARELEIMTRRPHMVDVDGELVTATPATFRVVPAALRVMVEPA